MQIKIDLSIIRSRVYLKYIELRALMLDITYPSYFNFILFQSHKTSYKYFFYFLKKNQSNLKKQVATMQPLQYPLFGLKVKSQFLI